MRIEGHDSYAINHDFPFELRQALLMVALADAPATRKQNNEHLEAQSACKRKKEELLREKALEKATNKMVERILYHRMWHSKTKIDQKKDVTRIVRQHNKGVLSDAAAYEIIKENIKMRTVGLGFDNNSKHDLHITWTCKGVRQAIEVLADHLKWIIIKEKNLIIPDEPRVDMPDKPDLAVLGKLAPDADRWDEKYKHEEEQVRNNAKQMRRERAARGERCIYAFLQPWFAPKLSELVGERIDLLSNFIVTNDNGNEENVLRWCQGKVDKVVNAKTHRVCVLWDELPDVNDGIEATFGECTLNPDMWNQSKIHSWRFDIEVDLCDGEEIDRGTVEETLPRNENEETDYGSDSSSSDDGESSDDDESDVGESC